ncbi:MAG: two-component system response regulator BaeR [Gammaproteobacteria bacterium]|nr:MAG: two-component system response regulator BaeR [Gammaproteobacteria bacterium]
MKNILIVEDEQEIADLYTVYLEGAGFATHCLQKGDEVVAWVKQNWPALILLDLMLPGLDGIEVCRQIRAFSRVPIIIVSARKDEIDRLLGLELGADDYICKPFSPREVVIRVKNLLRRTAEEGYSEGPPLLEMDSDRQHIRIHGTEMTLSEVEFDLLAVLHGSPDRIFSREVLLRLVYKDKEVNPRTIDSHIRKMRRKIEAVAPEVDLIRAVYGQGYQFAG